MNDYNSYKLDNNYQGLYQQADLSSGGQKGMELLNYVEVKPLNGVK